MNNGKVISVSVIAMGYVAGLRLLLGSQEADHEQDYFSPLFVSLNRIYRSFSLLYDKSSVFSYFTMSHLLL